MSYDNGFDFVTLIDEFINFDPQFDDNPLPIQQTFLVEMFADDFFVFEIDVDADGAASRLPVPVSEPANLPLMAVGLIGLVWIRLRRSEAEPR